MVNHASATQSSRAGLRYTHTNLHKLQGRKQLFLGANAAVTRLRRVFLRSSSIKLAFSDVSDSISLSQAVHVLVSRSMNMLSVTDLSKKESFPGSEFKPDSIWTCWMQIDRQMQSPPFMPELHRWISKLTARHLQLVHQEIFRSPW